MSQTAAQLQYRPGDRYCPNHELQTVTAEHFFHVSDKPVTHLEGLCFDRSGDLYFARIYDGVIVKLDMKTLKITEVYKDDNLRPAAVKIHKDGRLFICCVEMHGKYGCIMTLNPDGSNPQVFLPGMSVDDLVFDSKGGFYFTHFAGTLRDPIGGVYYVTPDMKTVTPIFKNMAGPNGVALSTDEKVLWITETYAGRLHRIAVDNPHSACVPYQFTGYLGPDSCSIDEDDNVYVAMFGQGRVIVFNPYGYPIGQVLLPDRENGHSLCSSHPMVRPGAKELYITACDDIGGENAWLFRAGSYAKGHGKAFQFI
jgi:lactonase